jgi:hypothetical protein
MVGCQNQAGITDHRVFGILAMTMQGPKFESFAVGI